MFRFLQRLLSKKALVDYLQTQTSEDDVEIIENLQKHCTTLLLKRKYLKRLFIKTDIFLNRLSWKNWLFIKMQSFSVIGISILIVLILAFFLPKNFFKKTTQIAIEL